MLFTYPIACLPRMTFYIVLSCGVDWFSQRLSLLRLRKHLANPSYNVVLTLYHHPHAMICTELNEL